MSALDYILFGPPPTAIPGDEDLVPDFGSGDAFPAFPGLLQYNGLLLNEDSALDYFHVTSVDGFDDAELRDFRAAKPFDHGEDIYGSLYGGRSIVINGEIRAYNVWKTGDMREALKRAFAIRGGFGISNPERPLWIRLGSTVNDRLIYCKRNAKIEIPHAQPTSMNPWVPFMIPLRASDPRILSYNLNTHSRNTTGTFSIVNAGDFPAKMLLRFYGPGTMTLTREFESSLQTVTVGPLAGGSYIDILGSLVRDSNGNNAYQFYDSDSDKMWLGPGPETNDLQLDGTGMTSTSGVVISWRDSWM